MPNAETKVGETANVPDAGPSILRSTRLGAMVSTQGHGGYTEPSFRNHIFSMNVITNATPTAGHILGAAAAAVTQFAIFNPVASGRAISLLRFSMGVLSGTPAAGPVWHGTFNGGVPSLAANGTIRGNNVSGVGSVAQAYAIAAGAALTGGTVAPLPLMMTNFNMKASAQATTTPEQTTDLLDGAITLLPGTGWVPLHPGAGTSLLLGYSLTWEEFPI